MFRWLKKQRPPEKDESASHREESGQRSLDGGHSPVSISEGAAALVKREMERTLVARTQAQMTPEERPILLMTLGCFLIGLVELGLMEAGEGAQVKAAQRAMRRWLASHAWYEADVFDDLLERMPLALPAERTANRYRGFISPAEDLFLVANMAGYTLESDYAPEFGTYIGALLRELPLEARNLAQYVVRETSPASLPAERTDYAATETASARRK